MCQLLEQDVVTACFINAWSCFLSPVTLIFRHGRAVVVQVGAQPLPGRRAGPQGIPGRGRDGGLLCQLVTEARVLLAEGGEKSSGICTVTASSLSFWKLLFSLPSRPSFPLPSLAFCLSAVPSSLSWLSLRRCFVLLSLLLRSPSSCLLLSPSFSQATYFLSPLFLPYLLHRRGALYSSRRLAWAHR